MYKHPIAFLSVNNLTVARYAAAMMADYIGFCFDSSNSKNITVAHAKEIMGWLSGVKFIGEFYQRPSDEIIAIAMELDLDFVLLYGQYTDAELESISFHKITIAVSPWSDYVLVNQQIIDSHGEIFAIPFYSSDEDDTGVIDFTDISEKLEALTI